MASRTKQKEEARARRLAEEAARRERARRDRRLRTVGGLVIAAVAVVAYGLSPTSGYNFLDDCITAVVSKVTSAL